MAADRVLTQEEIDNAFKSTRDTAEEKDPARRARPYDFRRPDRIAKDQLRAIHVLHETFARTLASSLSAYLRAYVAVNLVSVEQLSYMEFSQCLPSPSCLAALGMKPFEGSAVLEINPTLVFPVLEMLLGGTGQPLKLDREITEIEQSIMDGMYRIILHDLRQSWQAVAQLEFTIETHETQPQLLRILAPNEAVVAISMEVRIGDVAGMMNIGIPSIVVKMLRQKFDQQWSVRKAESTDMEQERVLRLLQPCNMSIDGRLQGPTLCAGDLMALKRGDILTFDYPFNRQVDLLVNSKLKFRGHVADNGRKRAFCIENVYRPMD